MTIPGAAQTEAMTMTVQILIGVMGIMSVIAVYFWLVRGKGEETPP